MTSTKCPKQIHLTRDTRLGAGHYICEVRWHDEIHVFKHGGQWLGLEGHGMTKWHWPTLAAARNDLSWMDYDPNEKRPARYYIYSPRGFSNEYMLLRAETDREIECCEELIHKGDTDPDIVCRRITRREAERRAADNRRAYRTGEVNIEPAGATRITPASEYFTF